jgi:hypothetical protein
MSQRNVLDDLKSKLEKVGDDIKNTADKVASDVKEAAAAVEEKAKAAYQDAVDKAQAAVDKAKEAAAEALDKIKSIFQGIKDKAKEVVDNAKQDLAGIKQKAEDKISAIVDKLKHGEGALVCAATQRDKIESVLGEAGKIEDASPNGDSYYVTGEMWWPTGCETLRISHCVHSPLTDGGKVVWEVSLGDNRTIDHMGGVCKSNQLVKCRYALVDGYMTTSRRFQVVTSLYNLEVDQKLGTGRDS